MKQKTKKAIKNLAYWLIKMIYFVVFSVGVIISVVGWHNIDLCQNLRWINAEYDLELVENGSFGGEWSGMDCYMLGMRQLSIGLVILFLLSLEYVCVLWAVTTQNER